MLVQTTQCRQRAAPAGLTLGTHAVAQEALQDSACLSEMQRMLLCTLC